MNSIIWYNSEITVMGKPLVSKKCIENNVLYVGDFIKNERYVMTYEEFNEKYGRFLDFLEFYGIIKAIPATMKNTIRSTESDMNIPISNYQRMFQKCLSSRYYYNESIKNENVLHKVKTRWENTFDLPFETKFFSKLFTRIKVITLSTKLRSFLYTLLHQATVTNVQLFKWKIKPTDKCTFCNVETESILHLFWECQTARHMWNCVIQWYSQKTGQTVHLNSKKVLFCNPNSNALHCLNTICLITLQYIYASRCLGHFPIFGHLRSKILDAQNLEKYIAVKNEKLKKHELKWKGF